MFDETLIKLLSEMGSTGLAAVLMFWALRYVIKSSNDRAEADRELFSTHFDAIRGSYEELSKSERESHEREIRDLCSDFKLCVERMSSSTGDLADQVRHMRNASNVS